MELLKKEYFSGLFFNPNWPALGSLESYDNYWGVNWIWTVHVTTYHVLFSIGIPLLLSYLIFPEHNNQKIITNRALTMFVFFFSLSSIAWILSVYSEFNFIPEVPQYLLFIAIAALLFILTKKSSPHRISINYTVSNRTRRIFVYGFLTQLVQYAIVWFFPSIFQVFITLALYLSWILLVPYFLSKEDMYNARNIKAFIAGLLTIEILVVLVVDILSFIFTLLLTGLLLRKTSKKIEQMTSLNSVTKFDKN